MCQYKDHIWHGGYTQGNTKKFRDKFNPFNNEHTSSNNALLLNWDLSWAE